MLNFVNVIYEMQYKIHCVVQCHAMNTIICVVNGCAVYNTICVGSAVLCTLYPVLAVQCCVQYFMCWQCYDVYNIPCVGSAVLCTIFPVLNSAVVCKISLF